MTTPAGFIDIERVHLPAGPRDDTTTELICMRTEHIRAVSPIDSIGCPRCSIRVVFGSQCETWLITGDQSGTKNRIAQVQELQAFVALGCNLTERESRVLQLLASMQEISPGEVLTTALNHYARTSLAREEYEQFYDH